MESTRTFRFWKISICAIGAIVAAAALIACCGVGKAQAVTSAELYAEAQAAYDMYVQYCEEYSASSERYDEAIMQQLEAQAKIDEATAKIKKLQKSISYRMRSMYCDDGITFLDLLFGSKTFQDFATNWDLLDMLNVNEADLTAKTKALREEVQEEEKVLAEAAAEAEREMESAQEMAVQMADAYNSLSAEATALLQQEQQYAALAAYGAAMNGDYSGYSSGYSWTYDPSTANDVLARAYEWLGNGSYSYGACSPGSFDCSGFVSYCLSGSYTRLGSTTTFMNWSQTGDPQPGCVCVNAGHTGIYIGDGMMIHAASEGEGIIVGPVQDGMIYVNY